MSTTTRHLALTLAAVVVGLWAGAAQAALVLHYDFEGYTTAPVENKAAANRDGYPYPGATVVASGNVNRGDVLSLDGRTGTKLDVADNAAAITGDWTVAGWVNANTLGTGDPFASYLFDDGNSSRVIFMQRNISAGGNLWFYQAGGAAYYDTGISASDLLDGTWHHWAVTHDASATDQDLYIDGVLVADNVDVVSSNSFADALAFGGRFSGTGGEFTGLMDDLRIYDEVLSDGAIAALAGIPEPSTFAIWALGLLGLAWYGRRRK